jgi:hypothetical protein
VLEAERKGLTSPLFSLICLITQLLGVAPRLSNSTL